MGLDDSTCCGVRAHRRASTRESPQV